MEPSFTHPDLPRYTQRPFPAYRYLPFHPDISHPRNDPQGHSYGAEDEYLPQFVAADWCDCEPYLYAVDLFNHGYWWEAHEAWEVVWLAAGRETLEGQFVQGLIQLAGAQLKRFTEVPRGAQVLTESGAAKLSAVQGVFLGIEVKPFVVEVERCLLEDAGEFPRIELHF
ncbi:DUF309 domain-containing protein [Geopsychrobacter electrodiphilus]|uniref:DUF309 domain-containing protein n=1 Tax=Geopsychrobacter electrodiphilus TaxID=225196 RepID=UPI00037C1496|nr:DUF309 domain-containing protein [Geopsychrobacter electrodiphilus]